MKKIILLGSFLLINFYGKTQTISDAVKHIYYLRYESAKQILKKIIDNGKASSNAWYWLGEIYMKQGKSDSAAIVLEEGKKYFIEQKILTKTNPLLYVGYAHMLLNSGRSSEARKLMEEVLKESKFKNADALLAVAKVNIESKNGDIKWAIDLLGKAEKRDKKNSQIYMAFGDAYSKMIDGSNAVVNYKKAFDINPLFAEAIYKIGRIYKSQKNSKSYMDNFLKAYYVDSVYTPVLNELYQYYFYKDVVKAEKYLNAYIKNSDPDPGHAYLVTDLFYVSLKYKEAIQEAERIIKRDAGISKPRLYKLIAYSYAALGDSVSALKNMDLYFKEEKPKEYVVKDYELKAKLLEKLNPDKSVSIEWYNKALAAENDQNKKLEYMATLAELHQEAGNREREAIWRERIYEAKQNPSNLDLYKWGVALFSYENYKKADSVFAIYEEKYPEQIYGPLWRARSNALIDTLMEQGLAVPHYITLIATASKDIAKNKTVLLKAYSYLGTYEANITKNYDNSLTYFGKVLELDPGNTDAAKYSEILKNWIAKEKGTE